MISKKGQPYNSPLLCDLRDVLPSIAIISFFRAPSISSGRLCAHSLKQRSNADASNSEKHGQAYHAKEFRLEGLKTYQATPPYCWQTR